MIEDLMYLFSLVESILVGIFGVIALVIAFVAILVIIVIGLALEIVMLPVSIIALILYYIAGIGSMDWWNSIWLWFVEAGKTIVQWLSSFL